MNGCGPRIGFISSFDPGTGMAAIYYPDRCHEVTDELPVYMPCGLVQHFQKGDAVLVLHLSNGSEAGVVLGKYTQEPAHTGIVVSGDTMTLRDSSGAITLRQIIAKCG